MFVTEPTLQQRATAAAAAACYSQLLRRLFSCSLNNWHTGTLLLFAVSACTAAAALQLLLLW
jgi:hypothetical protein